MTLLDGELELVVAGETHRLTPGTCYVIPPDTPHRGTAVTDCRVLDVFATDREDYRGSAWGSGLGVWGSGCGRDESALGRADSCSSSCAGGDWSQRDAALGRDARGPQPRDPSPEP